MLVRLRHKPQLLFSPTHSIHALHSRMWHFSCPNGTSSFQWWQFKFVIIFISPLLTLYPSASTFNLLQNLHSHRCGAGHPVLCPALHKVLQHWLLAGYSDWFWFLCPMFVRMARREETTVKTMQGDTQIMSSAITAWSQSIDLCPAEEVVYKRVGRGAGGGGNDSRGELNHGE